MTPLEHELTPEEAAELLDVSLPFLLNLIDVRQLPNHKVGVHCRIRFADLMAYKRRRDAESEAALKELATISQNMKL
jgi:excisionase family DNA binding protein